MREATAKVTSKGQITIPVEIRKELAVQPGDKVTFVVDNGTVRVERARSWVERTAGIFKDHAIQPPPTAKELRDMAEEAIVEEVMESMERSARTSP